MSVFRDPRAVARPTPFDHPDVIAGKVRPIHPSRQHGLPIIINPRADEAPKPFHADDPNHPKVQLP